MAVYTTIDDAGSYFNTILWTGNSPSTQALTGVGFQPDFVWVKKRSTAAEHCVTDAARGVTETIFPSSTALEATRAGGLTAFGADGFTVGADGDFNGGAATFVGWNWLGGTTSGITTDGSTTITPSAYSFNQTSGFSVLSYTGNSTSGAKLAHGLGVAPEVVFIKNLGTLNDWVTYSKYVKSTTPEDWVMRLNNTSIAVDDVTMWNDTQPDSVNITLGNAGNLNTGYSYIAYCFAPVKGYSKFGSYTGNGNADGPFVYTGFRPAFVMLKDADSVAAWRISDNKRLGYNVDNNDLEVDSTAVEGTDDNLDILSNGFKIRRSVGGLNTSGNLNIYMAFAEAPFVNSEGVPCNAR